MELENKISGLEKSVRIGLGVLAGGSHLANLAAGAYKGSLEAHGIDAGIMPAHLHMAGTAAATAVGTAAGTKKGEPVREYAIQAASGAFLGVIAASVELAVGYWLGYAGTWIADKL